LIVDRGSLIENGNQLPAVIDNHKSTINNDSTIKDQKSSMTSRVRRAAIVAVAVACSIVLQAQTETGELRGVLSSVRGPLAGLEVRIHKTEHFVGR
jgi:hypothetical protein